MTGGEKEKEKRKEEKESFPFFLFFQKVRFILFTIFPRAFADREV